MSNKPEAASYHQLKAINDDKDFIIAMLDEEATEEEAKEANAKAMEEKADLADALAEENEELKARLSAMEEKIAAMEEAPEEEPAAEEVKEDEPAAEEEEEKEAMPAARGVAPVAHANGSKSTSARDRWNNAIQAELNNGRDRATAVRNANRKNPGLRAAYLNEIN